jgi:DNA-binding response OmpR family regulator
MIKILLVEDDDILGFIIKEGMELIGDYDVYWSNNPKEGLLAFDAFQPDVVVSDIEMPGMTGLELVKLIREKDADIPVILETGVSSSKIIMEAYNIGIDNYIKKPFLPAELDAYIQGLLRRINKKASASNKVGDKPVPEKQVEAIVEFGGFKFNAKQQLLQSENKKLELSVTESSLLDLLVRNRGSLVTKETIAEVVWGGSKYMNAQSLDVFIHNIRKYLSEDMSIRIKTVRGVGYVLEVL